MKKFLSIRQISSFHVFLFLFWGVILACGIFRLEQAAFGDETKVYLKPLFALYSDFAGYFTAPLSYFHRPPGVHFLYLPFLWITGPHLELIRTLNLIYFCSGIFFLYQVFSRENPVAGCLTLAFFVLTPIVQVYSVQYIGEPQLFALLSFYLWLLVHHRNKTFLILGFGIFLGLVRETSLAVVPATLVFFFLAGERGKKLLISFGPLIGCGLYWLFTYVKTGSFFHHVTIEQGHISLFRDPLVRMHNLREIFLTPYRLLPLLGLSGVIFLLRFKQMKLTPVLAFSIIIGLAHVLVFSGHEYAIPRYFFAAFPFAVFALMSVMSALSSRRAKLIFTLAALAPAILIGNPGKHNEDIFHSSTGYSDTWEYQEILKLHQQVIGDIKRKYPPGTKVLTSWPFFEILLSDYAGYGKKKSYILSPSLEIQLNEAPDVILYTDRPQQISEEDLHATLKLAQYRRKDYVYKGYVLQLYEKI